MNPQCPEPAPGAPHAAISARGLSRRFGRRWAFCRVDLEVPIGDRLLIIGANGSGKTTLLRTLATLLTPSGGELRLLGIDPRSDPAAVRTRLALLSHRTGLYEDLSAADNLSALARLAGRRADPAALLERVGLERRPDPVRAFSAGMRKRLQIAALLLQEPELILLDEPFAALDQTAMAELSALIRTLPGTVVIASHQIARAAALCRTALLLDGGLPRWRGSANDAVSAWQALDGARVNG